MPPKSVVRSRSQSVGCGGSPPNSSIPSGYTLESSGTNSSDNVQTHGTPVIYDLNTNYQSIATISEPSNTYNNMVTVAQPGCYANQIYHSGAMPSNNNQDVGNEFLTVQLSNTNMQQQQPNNNTIIQQLPSNTLVNQQLPRRVFVYQQLPSSSNTINQPQLLRAGNVQQQPLHSHQFVQDQLPSNNYVNRGLPGNNFVGQQITNNSFPWQLPKTTRNFPGAHLTTTVTESRDNSVSTLPSNVSTESQNTTFKTPTHNKGYVLESDKTYISPVPLWTIVDNNVVKDTKTLGTQCDLQPERKFLNQPNSNSNPRLVVEQTIRRPKIVRLNDVNQQHLVSSQRSNDNASGINVILTNANRSNDNHSCNVESSDQFRGYPNNSNLMRISEINNNFEEANEQVSKDILGSSTIGSGVNPFQQSLSSQNQNLGNVCNAEHYNSATESYRNRSYKVPLTDTSCVDIGRHTTDLGPQKQWHLKKLDQTPLTHGQPADKMSDRQSGTQSSKLKAALSGGSCSVNSLDKFGEVHKQTKLSNHPLLLRPSSGDSANIPSPEQNILKIAKISGPSTISSEQRFSSNTYKALDSDLSARELDTSSMTLAREECQAGQSIKTGNDMNNNCSINNMDNKPGEYPIIKYQRQETEQQNQLERSQPRPQKMQRFLLLPERGTVYVTVVDTHSGNPANTKSIVIHDSQSGSPANTKSMVIHDSQSGSPANTKSMVIHDSQSGSPANTKSMVIHDSQSGSPANAKSMVLNDTNRAIPSSNKAMVIPSTQREQANVTEHSLYQPADNSYATAKPVNSTETQNTGRQNAEYLENYNVEGTHTNSSIPNTGNEITDENPDALNEGGNPQYTYVWVDHDKIGLNEPDVDVNTKYTEKLNVGTSKSSANTDPNISDTGTSMIDTGDVDLNIGAGINQTLNRTINVQQQNTSKEIDKEKSAINKDIEQGKWLNMKSKTKVKQRKRKRASTVKRVYRPRKSEQTVLMYEGQQPNTDNENAKYFVARKPNINNINNNSANNEEDMDNTNNYTSNETYPVKNELQTKILKLKNPDAPMNEKNAGKGLKRGRKSKTDQHGFEMTEASGSEVGVHKSKSVRRKRRGSHKWVVKKNRSSKHKTVKVKEELAFSDPKDTDPDASETELKQTQTVEQSEVLTSKKDGRIREFKRQLKGHTDKTIARSNQRVYRFMQTPTCYMTNGKRMIKGKIVKQNIDYQNNSATYSQDENLKGFNEFVRTTSKVVENSKVQITAETIENIENNSDKADEKGVTSLKSKTKRGKKVKRTKLCFENTDGKYECCYCKKNYTKPYIYVHLKHHRKNVDTVSSDPETKASTSAETGDSIKAVDTLDQNKNLQKLKKVSQAKTNKTKSETNVDQVKNEKYGTKLKHSQKKEVPAETDSVCDQNEKSQRLQMCPFCNKFYPKPYIYRHLKIMHSEGNEKPIHHKTKQTKKSQEIKSEQQKYTNHAKIEMPATQSTAEQESEPMETNKTTIDNLNSKTPENEPTKYKCKYCGKSLTKPYINRHMKMHKRSKKSSNSHTNIIQSDNNTCMIASNSDTLSRQSENHTEELKSNQTDKKHRRYSCTVCGKLYKRPYIYTHLKQHRIKENKCVDREKVKTQLLVEDNRKMNINPVSSEMKTKGKQLPKQKQSSVSTSLGNRSVPAKSVVKPAMPCKFCGKMLKKPYLTWHERQHKMSAATDDVRSRSTDDVKSRSSAMVEGQGRTTSTPNGSTSAQFNIDGIDYIPKDDDTSAGLKRDLLKGIQLPSPIVDTDKNKSPVGNITPNNNNKSVQSNKKTKGSATPKKRGKSAVKTKKTTGTDTPKYCKTSTLKYKYPCTQCNYRFVVKTRYLDHLQLHMPGTPARAQAVVCTICDVVFKNKAALKLWHTKNKVWHVEDKAKVEHYMKQYTQYRAEDSRQSVAETTVSTDVSSELASSFNQADSGGEDKTEIRGQDTAPAKVNVKLTYENEVSLDEAETMMEVGSFVGEEIEIGNHTEEHVEESNTDINQVNNVVESRMDSDKLIAVKITNVNPEGIFNPNYTDIVNTFSLPFDINSENVQDDFQIAHEEQSEPEEDTNSVENYSTDTSQIQLAGVSCEPVGERIEIVENGIREVYEKKDDRSYLKVSVSVTETYSQTWIEKDNMRSNNGELVKDKDDVWIDEDNMSSINDGDLVKVNHEVRIDKDNMGKIGDYVIVMDKDLEGKVCEVDHENIDENVNTKTKNEESDSDYTEGFIEDKENQSNEKHTLVEVHDQRKNACKEMIDLTKSEKKETVATDCSSINNLAMKEDDVTAMAKENENDYSRYKNADDGYIYESKMCNQENIIRPEADHQNEHEVKEITKQDITEIEMASNTVEMESRSITHWKKRSFSNFNELTNIAQESNNVKKVRLDSDDAKVAESDNEQADANNNEGDSSSSHEQFGCGKCEFVSDDERDVIQHQCGERQPIELDDVTVVTVHTQGGNTVLPSNYYGNHGYSSSTSSTMLPSNNSDNHYYSSSTSNEMFSNNNSDNLYYSSSASSTMFHSHDY